MPLKSARRNSRAAAVLATTAAVGGVAVPSLLMQSAPVAKADSSYSSLPTTQTPAGGQLWYVYMGTGHTLDVDFDVRQYSAGAKPTYARVVVSDAANKTVFSRTVRIPDSGVVDMDTTGIKGTSGVWRVRYTALDENLKQSNINGTLADWKIIPRSSGGTAFSGRVWTEEYKGNQPLAGNLVAGRKDVRLYYLSDTGAAYRADYGDYHGGTSYFSADSLGLGDNNCEPYYRSLSQLSGSKIKRADECPGANQYRVFFARPDSSMPATARLGSSQTWVYNKYTAPKISNLRLSQSDPTTSHAGTFSLTTAGQAGTVELKIDTSGEGTFADGNVVTLKKQTRPGTTTFVWDGKDAQGNLVPSSRAIDARASLSRVGEIHFVNTDVEVRAGGIEVEQLTGPDVGSTLLSWDDRGFSDLKCYDAETQSRLVSCDTPNPKSQGAMWRSRTPSAGGVHRWDGPSDANGTTVGTWGNRRFIDDWTYMSDTASASLDIPAADPARGTLDLVKTHEFGEDANGDEKAQVGDTIIYHFTVTNTGPVDLTNVQVEDDRLTRANVELSCPSTDLAVGESMTCDSQPYTVTAEDVAQPTIVNTATATGDDPVGPVPEDTDTNEVPVGDPEPSTPAIDLVKANSLTKDEGTPGKADVNDEITYTFKVTNTGPVDLKEVTLVDDRLSKVDIDVSCPKADLAVDESMDCTAAAPYVVTADDVKLDEILNTAVVTGKSVEDDTEVTDQDSTATPPATPSDPKITLDKDVEFVKDGGTKGKADVDDLLRWTFTVKNTGDVTVSKVKVQDATLQKLGVKVTCDATTLEPGKSTKCASENYKVTAEDAAKPEIVNVAYAVGEGPGEEPVRSNEDEAKVPTPTPPPAPKPEPQPQTPVTIPSGVPVVGGKDATGIAAGTALVAIAVGAGGAYYVRRRRSNDAA